MHRLWQPLDVDAVDNAKSNFSLASFDLAIGSIIVAELEMHKSVCVHVLSMIAHAGRTTIDIAAHPPLDRNEVICSREQARQFIVNLRKSPQPEDGDVHEFYMFSGEQQQVRITPLFAKKLCSDLSNS